MSMNPFLRIVQPLARRIQLILARGVLKLVDDAKKIQENQVTLLAGETRDRLERFQEYGFTSHPFAEAEAIVLFHGGNRDHGIVIKVDDRRYRLKSLAAGEVALYDDQGNKVHLKRNNQILVESGDSNAKIELDGVAKKVQVDAGGAQVKIDGTATTVTIESGGVPSVTIGPANVLLEADASTSITLAPGVITFNAASYVYL